MCWPACVEWYQVGGPRPLSSPATLVRGGKGETRRAPCFLALAGQHLREETMTLRSRLPLTLPHTTDIVY